MPRNSHEIILYIFCEVSQSIDRSINQSSIYICILVMDKAGPEQYIKLKA